MKNKNHKRRLGIAQGSLTAKDIKSLLACSDRCALCGIKMVAEPQKERSREIDHIVPIAAGGNHNIGNVRVVCRGCNLSRPFDASDVMQESLDARVAV